MSDSNAPNLHQRHDALVAAANMRLKEFLRRLDEARAYVVKLQNSVEWERENLRQLRQRN